MPTLGLVLHGFWTAASCNGSGPSLSSGVGQVLAEWISDAPPFDGTSLTPARFGDPILPDAELRVAAVWQFAHFHTPQAERRS